MTDGSLLDISSILIAAFVQQCSEPFNCGMHPIEDPSGEINTVFCEDGFAYLSPEPPDKLILPKFDRVIHIKSLSSQNESRKNKKNNKNHSNPKEKKIDAKNRSEDEITSIKSDTDKKEETNEESILNPEVNIFQEMGNKIEDLLDHEEETNNEEKLNHEEEINNEEKLNQEEETNNGEKLNNEEEINDEEKLDQKAETNEDEILNQEKDIKEKESLDQATDVKEEVNLNQEPKNQIEENICQMTEIINEQNLNLEKVNLDQTAEIKEGDLNQEPRNQENENLDQKTEIKEEENLDQKAEMLEKDNIKQEINTKEEENLNASTEIKEIDDLEKDTSIKDSENGEEIFSKIEDDEDSMPIINYSEDESTKIKTKQTKKSKEYQPTQQGLIEQIETQLGLNIKIESEKGEEILSKIEDEDEKTKTKQTKKSPKYQPTQQGLIELKDEYENKKEEETEIENEEEETKEENQNDDNQDEDTKKLQTLTDELKSLTENVADITINEFNIEWGLIKGQPPNLVNCDDSTFVFSDDLMPFSMYFNQILLFIGYESALTVTPGQCITPNKKCIGSQLSVNRQKFEIVQIQKYFQPIIKNNSNTNNNYNNDIDEMEAIDIYSCTAENATQLSNDAADKLIQYIIKRLCALFPQMMMSSVPCCSHCFRIYSRISLSSPTKSTKEAKKPKRQPKINRSNYPQFRPSQSNPASYDRQSAYAASHSTYSTRAIDRGRQILMLTSPSRRVSQKSKSSNKKPSIIPATMFEPFQKTQSGLTVVQNISQETYKKSYKIYSRDPFPAFMQHP